MGTKHTCPICGQIIEGEETEPIKYQSRNRYFHPACYRAYLKGLSDKKTKESKEEKPKRTRKPKPQAELKEALGEEEYKDKKALFAYFRETLNVEPNPKIYALVDRYRTQFGCSYKGMLDTLVYLNEVLKKPLEGDVVGIVPYYYQSAREHYENLRKIEDSNADVEAQYNTRVVKIKRPAKTKRKEIDF